MGNERSPKDATELFLRHLFRRATLAALAASPISACHVAHGPGQPGPVGDGGRATPEAGSGQDAAPDGAFDAGDVDAGIDATLLDAGEDAGPGDPDLLAACDSFGRAVDAQGVAPAEVVDFLSVRRRYDYGYSDGIDAGSGWVDPNFTVLTETGTPCETATADACAMQVTQMPAEFTSTGGLMVLEELSIVTTAGDAVEHYAGVSRLLELFGDVDSLDEAQLLVASDAYYTCGGREVDGEYRIFATRTVSGCAPIIEMIYELRVDADGETEVLRSAELSRDENACIGRRPEGLRVAENQASSDTLGDYLARCAHLEAASVDAFEQLAVDLERFGAPRALVERAREAADDERRHAKVVGALSAAHGVQPASVDVASVGERSLEAIATENAVEGCVRETFGVLIGAHQALCAQDEAIRSAMGPIVRDETRHAALSWDVHLWAMAALEPAARSRVLARQREAVEQLRRSLGEPPAATLHQQAGLPAARVQLTLFAQLQRGLWRA